jgi:hypothetical protein
MLLVQVLGWGVLWLISAFQNATKLVNRAFFGERAM